MEMNCLIDRMQSRRWKLNRGTEMGGEYVPRMSDDNVVKRVIPLPEASEAYPYDHCKYAICERGCWRNKDVTRRRTLNWVTILKAVRLPILLPDNAAAIVSKNQNFRAKQPHQVVEISSFSSHTL